MQLHVGFITFNIAVNEAARAVICRQKIVDMSTWEIRSAIYTRHQLQLLLSSLLSRTYIAFRVLTLKWCAWVGCRAVVLSIKPASPRVLLKVYVSFVLNQFPSR